jgi:predicted AAA+ superfamily ATPase
MIQNNTNLILRTIFNQVIEHLSAKEMTVIIGPRQAGKTTMLGQIKEYLINKRNINPDLAHYFNLDLTKDLSLFSAQEKVIQFIKDRKSNNKILYLFIDEVQRIEQAGIFLKGIYDSQSNVKFILSGSSSLEIKSKIQEALTGRKRIFKLMPLDFTEYVNYKNKALAGILRKQQPISEYDGVELEKLINSFAVFGGYPRVAIEENVNQKIALIEELYNSYIEKDVVNFLKVKNVISFTRLVSLLSAQAGCLLNINQIAKSVGADAKTMQHYLDILENTFVIKRVIPFFTNIKKELVKMPKIYFIDSGIRNFAIMRFDNLADRQDKGAVFENTAAGELIKTIEPPHSIHYWRTTQKAEVDFIVRKADGEIIPIEVKAHSMDKIEISRSFRAFLDKYKPGRAFLLNYNLRQGQKINNTNLQAITLLDIASCLK